MAKHNDIGKTGELLAIELLISEGYSIIETNWRQSHCEVDIIAKQASTVIFVEVKTRTASPFASPLEAVDYNKIKHLVAAADAYMQTFSEDIDFRFDVITVIISNNKKPIIQHIVDAFLPPLQ